MIDPEAKERARELEAARGREFDALLEDEFGGAPPIAAILQRFQQGSSSRSGSPARLWLVAAMVLLGIGVVVALTWDARIVRDHSHTAAPQDPTGPVDVQWPQGVPRVFRPEQLAEVPSEATHLSLAMSVHAAHGLSRFANLRHLDVRLTPAGLARLCKLIMSGGEAVDGARLDPLKTVPTLRRLSIGGYPLGASDLAALRHLEHLRVLELGTLIELNDELPATAAKGGAIVGRPFDKSLGEAVAADSRASTLRLAGMSITAEGLRALAGAKLQSLILDGPVNTTPEVLQALGELTTLRRLELRSVHGATVEKTAGGSITRRGSSALSATVMQRLAALPALQSLTLDLCMLDHDAIAALPRRLRQLDLGSCFGIDGRFADVVAEMPELRELGLPLAMADDADFGSMWRPSIRGAGLHALRLTGDEAAAIIDSRVWHALRLDGQLTEAVTEALAKQNDLRALTLTPTAGSESLALVARLPQLAEITFVQADISTQLLQPLNDCSSLRSVVFEDCSNRPGQNELNATLRDGVVPRWTFRAVR